MSRLAARGHAVYYFACIGHHEHKEKRHVGPMEGSPGVNVYTVPYAPGVRKFAGVRKWLAAQQIARVLRKNKVREPIVWYYHPSLFALGYSHKDASIVYDVMDHFPSFDTAIDDVYFDELMMLAEADVIFTGGRALQHHTKRMIATLAADVAERSGSPGKNRHVVASPVCLPSGVDLEHFGKVLTMNSEDESAGRSGNVFGYFGAIDERIDWDIIRAAAAIPGARVVLAGPVLRSPPDVPVNVELIGPVPYDELPDLLAGFDVCMIPFRNTELVRFVSPTKTPEYLAGGKPVVSTPVPDVIADYNGVVAIGETPEDFATACERFVEARPIPEDLAQEAAMRARTWDQIADEMDATVMAKTQHQSANAEQIA